MTNIIHFRTREEWEKEKREKVLEKWLEWLEFEKTHASYMNKNENKKEAMTEEKLLEWLHKNNMI